MYVLKKPFSVKWSYGHVECSFDKPAKKIDKKPKTFWSLFENDEENILFSKLCFSWNCFYRYVECIFDRPAKGFLLKYRKWSGKKFKNDANFPQKKLFYKKFPWRGRKPFENPAEVLSTVYWSFSTRNSKNKTICNFREKNSTESFVWKWESISDDPAEIFITKALEFFAHCPKKTKKNHFLGEKDLPKPFRRTRNFHFWQPWLNFFRQNLENFRFLSKNNGKVRVLKNIFFSSMKFLRTRRMHFYQTRQKNRQEAEKFCSVSENGKKIHLFSKTVFFSKNVSIDTENAVLADRPNFSSSITGIDPKTVHKRCKLFPEIFSSKCSYGVVQSTLKVPLTFLRQPGEIFTLDIRKKHIESFPKDFHPKVSFSPKPSDFIFDNPAETFATKCEDLFVHCPKEWKNICFEVQFFL